jgi:hypothetical protein
MIFVFVVVEKSIKNVVDCEIAEFINIVLQLINNFIL